MQENRLPLNPITLRFRDAGMEEAYEEEYSASSLPLIRVTLIMGALLYAAFGYLDYRLVPQDSAAVWAVRFPLVLLILVVFASTYLEGLHRRLNEIMSTLIVVAGLNVVVMMWRWPEELGYFYVSGVLMIFMYAHGHLRMRFIYATGSTWLIILIYALIVPLDVFIDTGMVLGGAVVLCMFASYVIEFYDRKSFWHRMMIDDQRRLLEKEHARKSRELESARRLQLSLLPQEVPDASAAEIGVAMRSAAEIGGDYYDFVVGDDGSVTFAIGDATGHGAEAGALVMATKILFSSLSHEEDVANILTTASGRLKRIGVTKLYMAMAVGRIRGSELHLAGAGMPPAVIYRAATGDVEEVPLKGMPLGSFADYPYTSARLRLDAGDAVILMTDGFPESFNEEGEMFGYDRALEVVRDVARMHPSDGIAALMDHARAWCGDRPVADDITFMMLRAKPVEHDPQQLHPEAGPNEEAGLETTSMPSPALVAAGNGLQSATRASF